MRRLPPLNALKAYEAAASHLSFTRGAEALNVSQSAISQQVRLLESHLGKSLFQRLPSGLALTDDGTKLFESAHEAFDILLNAVAEIRDEASSQEEHSGVVTLMMRPFLSFNWLSPRLSEFYRDHPDGKIRLQHTNSNADFEGDSFDIAIILGDGNWPNMDTEFLMHCELTPLCNPKFCSGERKPQQLSDLSTNTLLHESKLGNWPRWLALAGDPDPGSRRHVFIDDTNVRIQAAINGQGVALSNPNLLSSEIEKGNLVAPFEIMLTDYSYYVVSPKSRPMKRKAKVLKEWLIRQAGN